MMNKPLKKSVSFYSGIAGALLLSENVNAQVIYTDVSPDTLFNSFIQPYNLDLNSDSIADFRVYGTTFTNGSAGGYSGPSYHTTFGFAVITAEGFPNRLLAGITSPCNHAVGIPQQLNYSANIDSVLTGWYGNGILEASIGCVDGWPFGNFNYIGLKFQIGGQMHYGWIRIKAVNSQSFIISDYAYESQPNVGIRAGSFSSVGLAENFENSNLIQQQNNFTLQINNGPVKNYLSVKNILGQEIMKQSFSGNTYDFSINNKGIFLIQIINGKNIQTKKVFVY